MTLKIATWNINSVRLRMPQVERRVVKERAARLREAWRGHEG